jgi:hypothetical protein
MKVLMVEMQREMKSRWTIPYSELHLLGKIGMGDFGIVYLAKWRNSKGAAPPTFTSWTLASPHQPHSPHTPTLPHDANTTHTPQTSSGGEAAVP